MEAAFIELTVPGRPVAKARPRWDIRNAHMYTPERTRNAEEIMRGAMREACSVPLTGALELGVKFCFQRPSNWAKSRRDAIDNGEEPWHEVKPDRDNLLKLVKDAGNGVLWGDDAQIVTGPTDKVYSACNQTVITLRALEPQLLKRN